MHVRAGHRLDQDWLLPLRMDEWIPAGHLARVVDALVARLDLRAVQARYHQTGAGAPPYDPALLSCGCSCTGISRSGSARARWPGRVKKTCPCCGWRGGERPRHSVLATFRAQCAPEIPGWMAQVVLVAMELGLVGWQLGAVDGSKIHADASKHKAMSYQRMQALVAAHGAADAAEGAAPVPVPPDRRDRLETRWARIQTAMAALESAAAAEAAESVTKVPAPAPDPGTQYNFTDPESAIMVTKTQGVQQAYNTPILVEAAAGLIVGLARPPDINNPGRFIEDTG